MFRIKTKFYLIVFIIEKNFEIYRQNKNVDFVLFIFNRYHEFFDICFRQITNILFKYEFHDYVIYFKNDKRFSIFVLYDINYNEIFEFRRYLNENLNKKFIRINRFDTIVSILFVKKSKNNFRFCVNYKNLNVIIVKNRYFLFLILEILNRFNRIKIFTKLNIIVVFNRIRIRENDETLIAFRIRFELFEYLIMFFDLCNKFISFQKYINEIFQKFLNDFCIAYFDNILIYNNNETKHELHVKFVFQKFRDVNFQINIIKCAFYVKKISYLNFIITIEKIKMNFVKVDVIVN